MSKIVDLPPVGLRADGLKAGGWWHADEEPGRIVCDLCPRACALRPGDRGFCFVRENNAGEMVLSTYGRSTGFCIDPVEKKPLNHFYPGTSILSFGTAGCNLGCKFCQNWSISKSRETERLSEEATPEAIAAAARRLGCKSVAFTYNDPVVWAEYAIDVARACHAVGLKTVAVTAGYITPAARGPFYEVMDAANVDLKGFTESFYRHLTLSHLEPVLETLRWLKHETDVWFEITNLMIPRANDSLDEIRQMCQWVLDNLGPDVPLHFTAFHPDFRLQDRGPTPPETLLAAYDIASGLGLNYVYAGNVHAPRHGSTWCPACDELLIERDWYDLGRYQLDGNRCRQCGHEIAGHFDAAPGNWGRKRLPVRIADFASNNVGGASAALKQVVEQTEIAAPARPNPPASMNPLPTVTRESISVTPGLETAERTIARPDLTADEKQALLRAAATVVAATATGQPITLSSVGLDAFTAVEVLGAFVTLRRSGRLRSCCGAMSDRLMLAQAVFHAAMRSAIDDHRFPPVTPDELRYLDLDVWILHSPRSVTQRGEARREAVTIGKHGLQIAAGQRRGLLLPGVAVENHLDAESFLQQVCIKAGLPPTAWKDDNVALSTFEGEMIDGELRHFLPPLPEAGVQPSPSRLTPADLNALADFCRGNIWAAITGATPSYFAFGVSDDNVNGVALMLDDNTGHRLLQTSQFSLRQLLPLQSTLYAQAEEIGKALAGGGMNASRLGELQLRLAVLYEPAMHGTVAAPDLRGFDARRHSLVVLEGSKSAIVFNEQWAADDSLAEARRLARVGMPESAAVYSAVTLANISRFTLANVPAPQAGARIRPAAVAGTFYPADAAELNGLVDELLAGPAVTPDVWPAVMIPHAGLQFSGRLAADVLRRVVIPERVIIIGPKHTRLGVDRAVAPHQTWSIPGADIQADPELARDLVEAIPGLQLDAAAHQQEHAIEVELPFFARLAPQARVTGIAIGSGNLARCRDFADGLAACLKGSGQPTLLVISSDMNHFANDTENRRLDEMALAAIETLDPAVLYDVVTRNHISMCGMLPAVIVMETLQRLGGLKRFRRVGYATSGDITGDRGRVVGYAGMLLS